MKLLLNTHASNEFAEGCDWAFLDLSPALARGILQRLEIFERIHREDEDLTEMRYFDCSAVFLDSLPADFGEEADAESVGLGDGNPFVEIPEATPDPRYTEQAARTECDRLVISAEDCWWRCYPKHCDWTVETRPIDYATVRRAAGVALEAVR